MFKNTLAGAATALIALTSSAAAFDISAMTDADRSAFQKEIRTYLMQNPEVIIEAVNALEARQQAEQANDDAQLVQTNLQALQDDGFSWVGGNPEGDITVVEFLDYRCGYCRKAYDEVETLMETDGNIRFVIKEFPILGEASLTSSQFAIAAKHMGGSEAYKAAHDALISYSGDLSDAGIRRLAEGLSLDADTLLTTMKSDAVAEEIAKTRALAQRLNVRGTPTFVIGDDLLRGYVPLDGMRQIVADNRG